jgi:myosin heavy subunit
MIITDIYCISRDFPPKLNSYYIKPVGVFNIIDEETTFPKSTDSTLKQKLDQVCSSSPLYTSTVDNDKFSVKHYAGNV